MKFSQVTKQCLVCKTPFSVRKYREQTAKYCGIECQNRAALKLVHTCKGCKKDFTTSASRTNKKFCSMECRSLSANTTTERRNQQKAIQKLRRGSNSSRNLRKQIFRIVEPVCAVCDYNDKIYCIELHHIDNNPNNNNFDNIAVLCVICHRKLHNGDLNDAAQKRLIRKNYKLEHTGTD